MIHGLYPTLSLSVANCDEVLPASQRLRLPDIPAAMSASSAISSGGRVTSTPPTRRRSSICSSKQSRTTARHWSKSPLTTNSCPALIRSSISAISSGPRRDWGGLPISPIYARRSPYRAVISAVGSMFSMSACGTRPTFSGYRVQVRLPALTPQCRCRDFRSRNPTKWPSHTRR